MIPDVTLNNKSSKKNKNKLKHKPAAEQLNVIKSQIGKIKKYLQMTRAKLDECIENDCEYNSLIGNGINCCEANSMLKEVEDEINKIISNK